MGTPVQQEIPYNQRLKIRQLKPVGEESFTPVRGTILARVSANTDFSYGDLIRMEGRIVTPAENEDFSYREYLANQGIYSYLYYPSTQLLQQGQGNPIKSALYDFKQKALDEIYTLFPDPEASLMAGILLGVETGIPETVQEAFRLTGTSHIIVISGFHITILSGLFTLVFIRLLGKGRRYLAAVFSAGAIAIYTVLVGAGAAVVRAAIMGGIALFGRQLGKRQTGLNSLGFVAAVMALFDPQVLWDVSFQLSFAATLGLVLYARPLQDWLTGLLARRLPQATVRRISGPVGEYFLFTLAAQVMTLPVIAYHFQRISLVSILANPIILPAQPPVMVLGGAGFYVRF